MRLGTASVIRANSRSLPLADNSVDLVVTSPPYFALRSYQDGGEHYAGQIGDEPTPAEFVSSLLEVTAECVRVLKPSGSLWVNLGDKYSATSTPGPQSQNSTMTGGRHKGVDHVLPRRLSPGAPPKSLIGIPWRYALRCIDDLGLILRAEVIWSKPNGLPESVTDRVRRSHEQWFHFTLQPRYFSAVDEIREAYEGDGRKRGRSPHTIAGHPNSGGHDGLNLNGNENPLGKLPGSVWRIDDGAEPRQPGRPGARDRGCTCGADRGGRDRTGRDGRAGSSGLPEGATTGVAPESVWEVPTEPLRVPDHLGVDHFAAFPTQWPKRIIQGWSPEGGTVLDPFGGTGTTAMVAKALGRHGISVDMSADYCRLAEWRTNDRDQLAKVLGIAKVDAPTQDESLFDLLDGGAA